MKKLCIYGLFAPGFGRKSHEERCIYVGKTKDPAGRELAHLEAQGQWDMFPFTFRQLRWCEPIDAARIESQVIRAYRRKGQAIFNTYCKLYVRKNGPVVTAKKTTTA